MKPTVSIRTRLALSATLLVLLVVGVIASVAYRSVQASAISGARSRLEFASRQVADLLGTSARQVREQARLISHDASIRSFLAGTGDTPLPAATDLLSRLAAQAPVGNVEAWDARGRPRMRTSDTLPVMSADETRALIDLALANRDSVAIGWLSVASDHVSYAIIGAVADGGRLLGYVVQRRPSGTSQSIGQIRALVGDATLLAGNARGDAWNDLARPIGALPVQPDGKREIFEYERPAGNRVIAAFSPIPLTPWVIGSELPRSAALAPANTMLARLGVVTLLLLVLAAVGAWLMSRSLTRPIGDLVSAAEGMSAGDDSRRVAVKRLDEIGVLGVAFNAMAERVVRARVTLEKKMMEVADAEERYHMLFDANPQASWVYDVETKAFLAVNEAAVKLYGFSRDEFLARTILDIRPAEDHAAVNASLKRLGRNEEVSAVWRHRAKDGTMIDVEVSSRPVPFGGRAARLVVIKDLSERRRAEESLRVAQERLERVIGSSGAVLYELRLEPSGTILEWISSNVHDILGYSTADVHAGNWWSENLHPEDLARLRGRPPAEAFRDGSNEYRFRHKDGRYRWLREEQRLVSGADGEPPRVVGAWVDVTEQKQLEAQFRQAQKMDAVGRLAGGVAHDFNNLLTIIYAEAQLIMSGEPVHAEELREAGEQIHKAADRAAGLTRQLLTFSRRQFVEPSTLDLNTVVADVDKMLRRLIGEDIDLRVALADGLLTTTADRGQVEQVVVNLVVNARDAMPNGGALTIETSKVVLDQTYAETRADVTPGEYVLLSVSDTGTGMTEEVKAHIFEPFFTTKEAGKGTGLGLATCYAIAKQFGGHIAAYSEPGLGTTMKVYLPASADVVPAAGASQPAATGGHETILVVEDDTQVRRITVRLLTALGYTVLEAKDSNTALEMFDANAAQLDALVTDVVLPGMGGRQLAEQLRERRPKLPVLFLSGYSDDMVLRHGLLAEGMALLQKPFTHDALAQALRGALSAPA